MIEWLFFDRVNGEPTRATITGQNYLLLLILADKA
jgi:hypothetical protein